MVTQIQCSQEASQVVRPFFYLSKKKKASIWIQKLLPEIREVNSAISPCPELHTSFITQFRMVSSRSSQLRLPPLDMFLNTLVSLLKFQSFLRLYELCSLAHSKYRAVTATVASFTDFQGPSKCLQDLFLHNCCVA